MKQIAGMTVVGVMALALAADYVLEDRGFPRQREPQPAVQEEHAPESIEDVIGGHTGVTSRVSGTEYFPKVTKDISFEYFDYNSIL